MSCTCRAVTALVVLLTLPAPGALLGATEPPGAAKPSSSSAAPAVTPGPHIRTTDVRMRRLLEEGMFGSRSLRALVERIQRSDVVVYVHCERYAPSRVAGRLTFVSAAGGVRYVVVRLMRLESRAQQIALLAHELQHAVEIADTPAIVDAASLAREYHRIGQVNTWSTAPGIAFDTIAAVDMGHRVLSEIAAATGE
jgi:hypothetical protein